VSDEIDRPPERLGARLKLAREGTGLSLSELALRTHVRRAYLEALEEGRYADLPEDVYARNFVRLYGQALGLETPPLVDTYQRERRDALGVTTMEQRLDRDRRAVAVVGAAGPTPRAATRPVASRWPAWLFGPWLATVALVVVVVGLAAWGFDRLFALPTAAPPATNGVATGPPAPGDAPGPTAGAADPAAGAPAGAAPPTGAAGDDAVVRIMVVTEPPGAEITIDGFPLPGRTPLLDVPVTARAGRVVRAELDGFAPAEARYDLLIDGRVELTLTPLAAAGDAAAAAEVAAGRVELTITDPTWLEVYRSGARNEGERLVFTTAQPGATYEFALPVYVYVGNAAGARVNLAGQDLGPMGAPGAVLGRAFGP
jgi:cytoskeleton protein RodZ